jgi:hypothetical protein
MLTTLVKGGKPSTNGQQSLFLHCGPITVTAKTASTSKACLSCKNIAKSSYFLNQNHLVVITIYFTVPIYDAHDISSDFTNILTKLYKLPRYSGDALFSSYIIVGYTASTFTKEFPNVSCNIHWL